MTILIIIFGRSDN